MALGRDDPAQSPARHVEVLGKARHDEQVVGVHAGRGERRAALAVVAQPEVDLVDDEAAAARSTERSDPRHLIGCDLRAGRIRGRGDQHRARALRPRVVDRGRRELITGFRTRGNADRRPLEHTNEMPAARIGRIGQQHFVVAVDDEREHEQQCRGRSRGHDDALGCDRDAEVVGIVLAQSPCGAPGCPAPTCSRSRRRRARAARRRAPVRASGSPARRFPCGRRSGLLLRARARPSALPSRGTGQCRLRGRQAEDEAPSNGRLRVTDE